MPVTHFRVRWPDQSEATCYSPSSVVSEFFVAGQDYALEEFLVRARQALGSASERVRARYGYACSSAMDQLEQIESTAARFGAQPDATVRVLGFGR
ncbi:MSMEG_0570 family nitrogen starvation response protein [Cupriavidus basilensis]|uniref:MSMEG_0570 family nitrogen starvation response protein n=1 Tax=Cupriavidus basilensis TaxID=68895 RepID=A0ABT6AGN2_9BURK|nr:MSMEG_0570 family nitrogen starvation response protein [Cupriavidus basilensis]MDF3831624.1 MSMEG_0570 family nitrogen starvation response protein [Cupriavidus basilensis]